MLASFRPSCDSFGLHENHERFRAIFWDPFFDFENENVFVALFCDALLSTAHTRAYAPTWGIWIMDGEDTCSTCFCGGPASVCPSNNRPSSAICTVPVSALHRHDIVDNHRSSHICILIALSLHTQQNETQRGFPLPNGDRFVGLGLSTLPCTLYY
jgi:hypothetical protein